MCAAFCAALTGLFLNFSEDACGRGKKRRNQMERQGRGTRRHDATDGDTRHATDTGTRQHATKTGRQEDGKTARSDAGKRQRQTPQQKNSGLVGWRCCVGVLWSAFCVLVVRRFLFFAVTIRTHNHEDVLRAREENMARQRGGATARETRQQRERARASSG